MSSHKGPQKKSDYFSRANSDRTWNRKLPVRLERKISKAGIRGGSEGGGEKQKKQKKKKSQKRPMGEKGWDGIILSSDGQVLPEMAISAC